MKYFRILLMVLGFLSCDEESGEKLNLRISTNLNPEKESRLTEDEKKKCFDKALTYYEDFIQRDYKAYCKALDDQAKTDDQEKVAEILKRDMKIKINKFSKDDNNNISNLKKMILNTLNSTFYIDDSKRSDETYIFDKFNRLAENIYKQLKISFGLSDNPNLDIWKPYKYSN